jgi:hypothetical protein
MEDRGLVFESASFEEEFDDVEMAVPERQAESIHGLG